MKLLKNIYLFFGLLLAGIIIIYHEEKQYRNDKNQGRIKPSKSRTQS